MSLVRKAYAHLNPLSLTKVTQAHECIPHKWVKLQSLGITINSLVSFVMGMPELALKAMKGSGVCKMLSSGICVLILTIDVSERIFLGSFSATSALTPVVSRSPIAPTPIYCGDTLCVPSQAQTGLRKDV
jgi:hypothetical protein